MKYPKDRYIGSGIYGDDDEDIRCHSEKLVSCRKPHICSNCQKEIKSGEKAVHEKGFSEEGPVSCYTCLPCIEHWLDELESMEM